MTRGECEKAILEKCKEIHKIYQEYNSGDFTHLEISFNEFKNGNDFGDWKEQRIWICNRTFQDEFPDGGSCYQNHKPIEVEYSFANENVAEYQDAKRKWDEKYGEGDWDKETAAEEQLWEEHYLEKGVSGRDFGKYLYEEWLKKHNIEPLYSDDGKRILMIEDMDVFKRSEAGHDE